MSKKSRDNEPEVAEIAIIGEISEDNNGFFDSLLEVPPGGECIMYFDSPGGNAYTALALLTLMRLRNIQATGVALGECSSAALLPFSGCRARYVTPYSTLLFHPMRWESEDNIGIAEAAEWARHFTELEKKMDALLAEQFSTSVAQLEKWNRPGKYVTGPEIVEAGLAKMIGLECLPELRKFCKKC